MTSRAKHCAIIQLIHTQKYVCLIDASSPWTNAHHQGYHSDSLDMFMVCYSVGEAPEGRSPQTCSQRSSPYAWPSSDHAPERSMLDHLLLSIQHEDVSSCRPRRDASRPHH